VDAQTQCLTTGPGCELPRVMQACVPAHGPPCAGHEPLVYTEPLVCAVRRSAGGPPWNEKKEESAPTYHQGARRGAVAGSAATWGTETVPDAYSDVDIRVQWGHVPLGGRAAAGEADTGQNDCLSGKRQVSTWRLRASSGRRVVTGRGCRTFRCDRSGNNRRISDDGIRRPTGPVGAL